MALRPKFVLFDVMETLFPMEPLRERLQAAGLPPDVLPLWLARTLRDGFALSASNLHRSFRNVAGAALRGIAAESGHEIDDGRIDSVVDGFGELPPHGD